MKTILALVIIQVAFTSSALAGSRYCGTIEYKVRGETRIPQLAIYESLFFTGQVNRFQIVARSETVSRAIQYRAGDSVCLIGDLESVSGETVMMTDAIAAAEIK